MKASSFKYLVKEGGKNVWLNRMMSVASIGVLTACLLLIGFSWLITTNISRIITFLEDKNEVVFFVTDDATEEQISELHRQLDADSRLFDVAYISKEQGLEEYKQSMGDSAVLLEGLENEENPIPASFRFKVDDLSQLDEVVATYDSSPIKELLRAPTDVADTMTNISSMVTMGGLILIVALVIVSLVIIANTIRATVFSRRKEINIMKYVGATDNFIRLPFFVEGLLLGLISALLAFLCVWGGYSALVNMLVSNASDWLESAAQNILPFQEVALPLGLIFAGAGAFTGVVGSLFSVRSHLKV